MAAAKSRSDHERRKAFETIRVLNVAGSDGAHEVAVGAGLLVGIHFDDGGVDAEDVSNALADTLSLVCEVLGADAAAEVGSCGHLEGALRYLRD